MRFPALVLLAVASLFIFGCAGENGSADAGKNAVAPSAAAQANEKQSGSVEIVMHPEPQKNATLINEPPVEEKKAVVPAAQPEPINRFALLNVGDSLNFSEGAITLDDVWLFHETEPALMTFLNPDGSVAKKPQVFEATESSYVSPSGRRFWVYAPDIEGGYNIYVKRAKVYVVEAREGDNRFDKSLYSDFIRNDSFAQMNNTTLFGKEVARGVLQPRRSILFEGLNLTFDDLNHYPEGNNPVLLSLRDGSGRMIDFTKIPVGKAYVAFAEGKRYVIYNEASTNEAGYWASVKVYEAGKGNPDAGRIYTVLKETPKKTQGNMVDTFNTKSEKGFTVQTISAGKYGSDDQFAVVAILDEDSFEYDRGLVTKKMPMGVKDIYGRNYQLWLENPYAEGGGIAFSLYR